MSNQKNNYYQILGVKKDASAHEIKQAFERRRTTLAASGEALKSSDYDLLVNAYEALSSPERRNLYDSLLAESDDLSLSTEIQTSSRQIPVLDIPQLIYVLLELRPSDIGDQPLLPLNLCLVIDRSTSMRGDRLEQVKIALQMFVEKLSSGDVLSLVTFSDRAEVVLPAKHVGELQEPLAKIWDIQGSGGTELLQGLTAGMQQMGQVSLDEHNNQLILLTDGRTYGDAGQCLQLAARGADAGIMLHAFGIGFDWDDQFLDALVAPSGGCSAYIDSPQTIVSELETRLQGLGDTYARHVRLKQDWPDRVQLLDAFRLTPYAKPLSIDENEIRLGDIEGRTALTFLLEFIVAPHPIPARIRLPLLLEAEFPGKKIWRVTKNVKWTLLNDSQPKAPPAALIRAVRLLTLYRLNEQAWQEIEAGQVDKAAARMHHLSTRFLEVGEPRLAQQADIEARRLSVSGKLSAAGRKQLKYGTRALMGKTIQLEWHD